jgi:ribosomal protein L39E
MNMARNKSADTKRALIKHARKTSRPPVFAQIRKYGTRKMDRSRMNKNVGR